MNFKTLLLTPLLFATLLCAQDQENNHPCLDKEKMQKALSELTKNDSSLLITGAIKLGLLGKSLQQRVLFKEKFSKLSENEQQVKVEKWLKNESRKSRMVERCSKISELAKNKTLDDESLEKFASLGEEIIHSSLKEQSLCEACGRITSPKDDELTPEDRNFLNDLKSKFKKRREKTQGS